MLTKYLFAGWISLLGILFPGYSAAQENFGTWCSGNWKGTMYLCEDGKVTDSVPMKLTVKAKNDSVFRWKMEYLSAKYPLTKDYKLLYKNENQYQFDEGDDILIDSYLFANKLMSVFEVGQTVLTSVYELRNNNELYFEISSGIKEKSNSEVISYRVGFLQYVVFKRD